MKESLFLLSFEKKFNKGYTIGQAVDFAIENNFGAVELYPVAELALPDIGAAKRIAKKCAGCIEVSCFSMTADILGEKGKKEVDTLKRFIDVANVLGSKMFHHTIYPWLHYDRTRLPEYREVKETALERCKEVCKYAEGYGMTCVYEEQGFVVNGVETFGDFFYSLEADNKGVVADLGNILFVGDDPVDFVSSYLREIKHVHVKDYLFKSGNRCCGRGWYMSRNCDGLRGTVIGHGIVDHVRIFKLLNAVGFDGWYSVEFDGWEDPDEAALTGRENMKIFMEDAKRQINHTLG